VGSCTPFDLRLCPRTCSRCSDQSAPRRLKLKSHSGTCLFTPTRLADHRLTCISRLPRQLKLDNFTPEMHKAVGNTHPSLSQVHRLHIRLCKLVAAPTSSGLGSGGVNDGDQSSARGCRNGCSPFHATTKHTPAGSRAPSPLPPLPQTPKPPKPQLTQGTCGSAPRSPCPRTACRTCASTFL